MANYHPRNERIKKEYFRVLTEADQRGRATVDGIRKAILRYEQFTGLADFAEYDRDKAIGFKRHLAKLKAERSGKPLSQATILSTLHAVQEFFRWLGREPGYKSKIHLSDVRYFNLSRNDMAAARSPGTKKTPTLEQIAAAIAAKTHEKTMSDAISKAIAALEPFAQRAETFDHTIRDDEVCGFAGAMRRAAEAIAVLKQLQAASTVTLETTAEERARWAREADALLWETMEGPFSVILALLRDIDHLLDHLLDHLFADNEAKDRSHWEALQQHVRDMNKVIAERNTALAEITRLKARPTSGEVELQAKRLEGIAFLIGDMLNAPDSLREIAQWLRRLAVQGDGWRPTQAARDLFAERRRQIDAEGFSFEHDDQSNGTMAVAAACYAILSSVNEPTEDFAQVTYYRYWPWDSKWFKLKDRRRNLVRAGALILAEIERLDRQAEKGGDPHRHLQADAEDKSQPAPSPDTVARAIGGDLLVAFFDATVKPRPDTERIRQEIAAAIRARSKPDALDVVQKSESAKPFDWPYGGARPKKETGA